MQKVINFEQVIEMFGESFADKCKRFMIAEGFMSLADLITLSEERGDISFFSDDEKEKVAFRLATTLMYYNNVGSSFAVFKRPDPSLPFQGMTDLLIASACYFPRDVAFKAEKTMGPDGPLEFVKEHQVQVHFTGNFAYEVLESGQKVLMPVYLFEISKNSSFVTAVQESKNTKWITLNELREMPPESMTAKLRALL